MSAVLFAPAIVAAVTSLVVAVAPREAPVTLPHAALSEGVAAAVAAVTPLVAAVSIPVAPVT